MLSAKEFAAQKAQLSGSPLGAEVQTAVKTPSPTPALVEQPMARSVPLNVPQVVVRQPSNEPSTKPRFFPTPEKAPNTAKAAKGLAQSPQQPAAVPPRPVASSPASAAAAAPSHSSQQQLKPKKHKSKYGPNPVTETNVGWVMGNKKIPRGRSNSFSTLLSSSPGAASLGTSPANDVTSVSID